LTIERSQNYLISLLNELRSLSSETEWVEFKHNDTEAENIGRYISALANSAALMGKSSGYVVWGIEDRTHEILGTTFSMSKARHKQQELENWLLQKIDPKNNFHSYEFFADNHPVTILEVTAASNKPVRFDGVEYIRIGSYTKKLCDFPEKEKRLWKVFDKKPFEEQHAAENVTADEVLDLLDYSAYFDLFKRLLPEGRLNILTALKVDHIIEISHDNLWHITNLGAILFAKNLSDFKHLGRKAIRLILYRDKRRIETIKEIIENRGYAIGFMALIEYIKVLVPTTEKIGTVFRQEIGLYPDIAIRELVANALIHQDFSLTGTGPMIELFNDRMEITNPGTPLIETQRFLDNPPQSRNEKLASFMRRIGICEERGSGIDKVVYETEQFQLPAPIFEKTDYHTRVVLFSPKSYTDMSLEDKVRACYLHCSLKYVNREIMNNTSLRGRFGLDEKSSAPVSRIIKQTVKSSLIKAYDEAAGTKAMRYIPYWA
jgi:ATP-dependent DNA helicase RecG